MGQDICIGDFSDLPKSCLTGKPVLHFVHANGIPAPTYAPLFAVWEQYFSIERIDFLGMDARYPIDEEWASLTLQVGDSIGAACKKHGVSSVVAVGHSVGAVTTLQVLARSSKNITCAILLDPSLLLNMRAFGWFLARQTNRLPFVGYRLSDKMSPAAKSKYRKDTFESREDAYQKLRHKGLFRAFDEACFMAYLDSGFVDVEGGVKLAISREAEVAIFRTMPMYYWYKKPSVKIPVTLIAGENSEFAKMGSYELIKRHWGIDVVTHQGSHMFPLEFPQSVARLVLASITK